MAVGMSRADGLSRPFCEDILLVQQPSFVHDGQFVNVKKVLTGELDESYRYRSSCVSNSRQRGIHFLISSLHVFPQLVVVLLLRNLIICKPLLYALGLRERVTS